MCLARNTVSLCSGKLRNIVEVVLNNDFQLLFWRVRKIAKSGYYLRYVRLSARNSAPTGRILMKL